MAWQLAPATTHLAASPGATSFTIRLSPHLLFLLLPPFTPPPHLPCCSPSPPHTPSPSPSSPPPQVDLGFKVYGLMRRRGIEPSVATYGTLVCIAADAGASGRVIEVRGWVENREGVENTSPN